MLSSCYKITTNKPKELAERVVIVGNDAAQVAIQCWAISAKTVPLIVTGAIGTGKTTSVKQLVPDWMEFDFDLCSSVYVAGQYKRAEQDSKTLIVDNCHCFASCPAAKQVFLKLLKRYPNTVCITDQDEFSALLKPEYNIVNFKALSVAELQQVLGSVPCTTASPTGTTCDGDARQALISKNHNLGGSKDCMKSAKTIIKQTLAGHFQRDILCEVARYEGPTFGKELMQHVHKHYSRTKQELGQFEIAAALSDCDVMLCDKRRISEDDDNQCEFDHLTEISMMHLGSALKERTKMKRS